MYYLPHTANPVFPPVDLAHESGLLAIGGKLNPRWILNAYRQGIFPWFTEGEPYCWFCPNPRLVLFPEKLKISKSMRAYLRKSENQFSIDMHFAEVIRKCADIPRDDQAGTWITDEMQQVYTSLHHSGYAHSFEWTSNGKLIGGLYGLCLNRVFYGESMFSEESNASKAAFILCVKWLQSVKSIRIIDCQIESAHLQNFGAELITRKRFTKILKENNAGNFKPETWCRKFNTEQWKQFL